MRNSIIANSATGGDCATTGGTLNIQNTLVEDSGCGITNGVNGNKTGDPDLGSFTSGYFPLNSTSTGQLTPGTMRCFQRTPATSIAIATRRKPSPSINGVRASRAS